MKPFNIRAGILLMPVGKFNLLHDSPLNDLTDRPMVPRFVIPSNLVRSRRRNLRHLLSFRTGKLDYEIYCGERSMRYQDGPHEAIRDPA